MRHLAAIRRSGAPAPQGLLVELGPGSSVGVSVAALLSGMERAVCLDLTPLARQGTNLRVLGELVALFRERALIPSDNDFPKVRPTVGSVTSPVTLLEDGVLERTLDDDRLLEIERSLEQPANAGAPGRLQYIVPWSEASVPRGEADLVLSQAVLQYLSVDPDPEGTAVDRAFSAMRAWLRPGGLMSHQIDLSSPFGPAWNAHWTVGDATWALIRGRRASYENRLPLSGYLTLLARHGFDLVDFNVTHATGGAPHSRLVTQFRDLPASDYTAQDVHILARKR